MKARNGAIVALLFLATCNDGIQTDPSSTIESSTAALGIVPPTEVAVWQKAGSSTTPDGRYLQAAAFDETRKVVVMFGGTNFDPNTGSPKPNKETWEWSPVTGKWTNRTLAGMAPEARSGAAMVFDSLRSKFVLFGGRSGGGFNYEDTWEWDPTTGVWTDATAAGAQPSARSQHGMVYEKSTGKILLFGGGRSVTGTYDAVGITASLGDTWELDPVAHVWTVRTVTVAPSARHDFGLAWDSSRNKAVLFAGLQVDIAGATGVPKQDTWEWDPLAGTWSERTLSGSKPGQRYAHAMAFDATRNKMVVFGGWDINTGGVRNDLWDWDPTTGAWLQRLTGSESGTPAGRVHASMVADDARARLLLVAGESTSNSSGGGGNGGAYGTGGYYGAGGSYSVGGATGGPIILPPNMGGILAGSRDVWELDPAKPAFTDRTPPLDVPTARYNHTMAYNPSTGKTYIFGGNDAMSGQPLDELWEWDGKTWALVAATVKPAARADAGLAYDPVRKSLILFGGTDYYSSNNFGDTWEFDSARKWTQLKAVRSPDALSGHGMVTDSTRNKILLFGGASSFYMQDGASYRNPVRNEVWEWDGTTLTWTNRTAPATTSVPIERQYPVMAYDEGRQKLFLYDGVSFGGTAADFWEWDPLSAGWTSRKSGEGLSYGYSQAVAYDSIRRREVMLAGAFISASGGQETWEVEAKGPTWYVRSIAISPVVSYGATVAFDKGRGVVVLFGGQSMSTGNPSSETWEYRVSNLGTGVGCMTSSASSCASGFCVDSVCCEVATCTGPCKSCNVAGREGSCAAVKAGTEVAGSCSAGLACDGSGNCTTKNGQACTSSAACASGFCADGVCCDSACTGACVSCNQAGQVGKCSPYTAGTDPQGECGKGTGVCKSFCDGVGNCAYPGYGVSCGNCMTCDGSGTCTSYDPYCGGSAGAGGGVTFPTGGSGGSISNTGGRGGSVPNVGGSGGGSSGGSSGGVGDAGTKANLSKSGCDCELGRPAHADPGLALPLFIGAMALLAWRRREPKRRR